MTTPTIAYLTVCSGSATSHAAALASYHATASHLSKIAVDYGLPPTLEQLDQEGREVLAGSDPSINYAFSAPEPYIAGTLYIHLFPSASLKKTRENFISLLTGVKGQCKSDRTKKLHYLGVPFHRIQRDFVAQGGDVTRGDGSGGESVTSGGSFKVDPEGLKTPPGYGRLAMASCRRDTNTSQFFLILTSSTSQLAKLNGKYSVFGQAILSADHVDHDVASFLSSKGIDTDALLKGGRDVFQRFEKLATQDGTPKEKVWVEECGVL